MIKKLILTGVVVLGFGLTSTLATQQIGDVTEEIEPDRSVETPSVVFKTKELDTLSDIDPNLKSNVTEVKDYHAILREINEEKERKAAAERERLRKLQEERERQRLLEEERQRKLAQERAEQLAKVKAEEERKAKEQSQTGSYSVKGTINMEFTYYTAFCNGCGGVTATGYDVSNTIYYEGMRIIATDPRVIPTWSIVQFEMNGQMVKAIALDTGGAIKGNIVDMLVASRDEAYRLGRTHKKVEILRYGK